MSLTDGLMQTEEKQQVLGQGQTAARPFSANATRRRYLVLLAFALNAGSNCFMFMDYNSVPAITKVLYGLCHDDPMAVALGGDGDVGGVGASASGSSSWTTGSTGPMVSPDGGDGDGDRCSGGGGDDCGNSFVGWTYSASLLAVMPAAVPVMAYLGRYNYLVSAVGMACNCAGAWLRYVSAEVAHAGSTDAGQALAILSSVLVGCGAAVIVCSYSAIPARHFPPHERTMATTVAVQANYSGWLVGALLFPYVSDRAGHAGGQIRSPCMSQQVHGRMMQDDTVDGDGPASRECLPVCSCVCMLGVDIYHHASGCGQPGRASRCAAGASPVRERMPGFLSRRVHRGAGR
jgi:hypothetical protein